MRNVLAPDHPGFEEGLCKTTLFSFIELTPPIVWPVIATRLEFKPQSSDPPGNNKEGSWQT